MKQSSRNIVYAISLCISSLSLHSQAAESAWPEVKHPGFTFEPVASIGPVSNTGLAFLSNGDMLLLSVQASTGAWQTGGYADGRVPNT